MDKSKSPHSSAAVKCPSCKVHFEQAAFMKHVQTCEQHYKKPTISIKILPKLASPTESKEGSVESISFKTYDVSLVKLQNTGKKEMRKTNESNLNAKSTVKTNLCKISPLSENLKKALTVDDAKPSNEEQEDKKPTISIQILPKLASSPTDSKEASVESISLKTYDVSLVKLQNTGEKKMRKTSESNLNAKAAVDTNLSKNSPVSENLKKVLTVDDAEFRKRVHNIMKPVQTISPRTSKVIVMDVAELRKNAANILNPAVTSTQSSELSKRSSPKLQSKFQEQGISTLKLVQSLPNISLEHKTSCSNNQAEIPQLVRCTQNQTCSAKPTEQLKSSSSEGQAKSGKKIIQIDDLQFQKVIKTFLNAPIEKDPTISASKKKSRINLKRKPISPVTCEPSKKPKSSDAKQPLTKPRNAKDKNSLASGVNLTKTFKSFQKQSVIPVPEKTSTKQGLWTETITNKVQPVCPAIKKNKPKFKDLFVDLTPLPDAVVKQCLLHGFIHIKRLTRIQKNVYLDMFQMSHPKLTNNSLPKDARQQASNPRLLHRPQKEGSLQTKHQFKSSHFPVESINTSGGEREKTLAPSKDHSGLATTILKWKAEMEKENAMNKFLQDIKSYQKVSSESTHEVSTDRNLKKVILETSPSGSQKIGASPQIIQSQRKERVPQSKKTLIQSPTDKKGIIQEIYDSSPASTKHESIVQKVLMKNMEKERLKLKKYFTKKTTRYVEKKLEQLQALEHQLLQNTSTFNAEQQSILKDVNNLLSSKHKSEVCKVFLHFGLSVLLEQLESKPSKGSIPNQCQLEVTITTNKVINAADDNCKNQIGDTNMNKPIKKEAAEVDDPYTIRCLNSGEKYLLECPCKIPNCGH